MNLLLLCPLLFYYIGQVSTLELNQTDKDFIVMEHNRMRSQVVPEAGNMVKMIWDDSLQAHAALYANQCEFTPKNVQWDGFDDLGRNMVLALGRTWNLVRLSMQSFEKRKDFYDYASNSCKDGQDCGHYTQIIWADSWKIGCALKTCNHPNRTVSMFFVCMYHPKGNYKNVRPYKNAPKFCDRCPESHRFCVDNLCHTTSTDGQSISNPKFFPILVSLLISILRP